MRCGAGAGWDGPRGGAGAGKISQIPEGRVGFKFCGCGAGADKKFQPAQDPNIYTVELR